MPALLLGSISTVCDTSELQRQAFNDAFAEHGLDWYWDVEDYREMLQGNGGAQRIADFAESKGEDVDAAAVHATKSRLFQDLLSAAPVPVRPGVADTVAAARGLAVQVALVTTTSPQNVDTLLNSAQGLGRDDFDLVLTVDDVSETKPSPEVYRTALERLGIDASDAVAVEDNVGGVKSAQGAGVRCVAFANENTAGHDFSAADAVVEALEPRRLLHEALGAGANA